jgi:anti-sigma regulatory factor (Ser/Thr protein kinase)
MIAQLKNVDVDIDVDMDVDLTFPIAPEMELKAIQNAEAVGALMELDRDQIDEITIALIEACLNISDHSHNGDGLVYIHFGINPEELIIRVSDPQRLQFKPRGWGPTILREFMDEVKIDCGANGTTITMVKRR